jgi:hypothetical protein
MQLKPSMKAATGGTVQISDSDDSGEAEGNSEGDVTSPNRGRMRKKLQDLRAQVR